MNVEPRKVLRCAAVSMTDGTRYLVAIADADMASGIAIGPSSGVVVLPAWVALPGRQDGGDDPYGECAWRYILLNRAQVVSIVPWPPLWCGRTVPIPPRSIPGWNTGTDDDTILLDLDKTARIVS